MGVVRQDFAAEADLMSQLKWDEGSKRQQCALPLPAGWALMNE